MGKEYNEQCEKVLELIRNLEGDSKEMVQDFEEWRGLKRDGVDRKENPNALNPRASNNVDKILKPLGEEVNLGALDGMKMNSIELIFMAQKLKGGEDVQKLTVATLHAMLDSIGWLLFTNEWTLNPGEILSYNDD